MKGTQEAPKAPGEIQTSMQGVCILNPGLGGIIACVVLNDGLSHPKYRQR